MSNSLRNLSGQGRLLSEQGRLAYLKAMGIQTWSLKTVDVVSQTDAMPSDIPQQLNASPSVIAPVVSKIDVSTLNWSALQQQVSQCQLCELHATRSQTVFGSGNQSAALLIIGAAPGADEDRAGKPFAGRAGELLDAMLRAIQLNREQVYLVNVLKCQPPQSRKPYTSELICCDAYLQRQISLLQPKIILALGETAARHVLFSQAALDSLRGRTHRYNGIPLIVSYHPENLLATPADKGKAWQDLLQLKQLLHS